MSTVCGRVLGFLCHGALLTVEVMGAPRRFYLFSLPSCWWSAVPKTLVDIYSEQPLAAAKASFDGADGANL